MDNTQRTHFLLLDAFPDIVIGLMGIPVAFSLQEVVEKLVAADSFFSWRGIFYMAFLVGFYGLYSGNLLITFDIGYKAWKSQKQRQRYWVTAGLFHFPIIILVTALIMAFGKVFDSHNLYDAHTYAQWCAWLYLSAHLPAFTTTFFFRRVRDFLLKGEFSLLVTWYVVLGALGFSTGLFWFTRTLIH